jgi:spore coat protein B
MINDDSIGKITRYQGNNVKVNLGGPESLPGRLLGVQSDYLTLDTKKDGVVYYPLRHVKSVSINSEDFSRSSRSARYHNESNFLGVVRNLHHKKVKINRGGPESVEGVVSNVFDNHLELTVNNDIVFISIYHIKSISQVGKDGRSSGKNRSGNRSSGNRSSGNRSSGDRSSGNRNRNRSSRSWGSNSRTSGNRSTSGRTGSGRNNRTTGTRSSRNDPRTSRVFEALAAAQLVGTDSFMFNDPRGSTGSRSSRRSRSTGSGRSRSSHHNRSHRSTGSGWSRSSHRSRSSRSSGCGCSTGRSRSSRNSHRNRSTGSGRSRNSHRNRSTGSSRRSRNSNRHRSSSGRGNRSSGHHRSRRRRRRRRTTGNTSNWNGMTVRRGGWIKLN